MPIDLYPSIAKVKRNGVYQNLPGFVQQSGDADIEAMIAGTETSSTAQYTHAKWSYFILNDTLYQADEDIEVNDVIAVGTNCHVAVLGDDVGQLKYAIENSTAEMNDEMRINNAYKSFENVVDYSFENDADIPATNTSAYTGIGVKRHLNIVELNTLTPTSGARIRVSGDVTRAGYSGTSANNIVKAWDGIQLTQWHLYRVIVIKLSGTVTVNTDVKFGMSVYEHGSASTIGTAESGDGYFIRKFMYNATPVNLTLLAVPNASYNNCKFLVVLEDITANLINHTKISSDSTIDYGFMEGYGSLPNAGSGSADCVGFEQCGEFIRLNGTNTTNNLYIKIKLCNGPVRTSSDATVYNWTGVDLIRYHIYRIKSQFISGSQSRASDTLTGLPISAYRHGSATNLGVYKQNPEKDWICDFVAMDENITLAAVVNPSESFNNAIFKVTLEDITDTVKNTFLGTAETVRLITEDNNVSIVGQSLVEVDGCFYIYSSNPTKIRKIDLINGTDDNYSMDLGHGNGMAYYNGYLYVCGMGSDGVIYKIDTSDMSLAESIVYKGNGTSPVVTSGIAYNYDTNKFILKVSGGFHIVSTSFVYESAITRKFMPNTTGQGISCDKDYIYVIESDPNAIHVYNYSGEYFGRVSIDNLDEAENVYNDGKGGWYLLTNLVSSGYYIDAIKFYRDFKLENIISLSKFYGKLDY